MTFFLESGPPPGFTFYDMALPVEHGAQGIYTTIGAAALAFRPCA